MIQFQQQNHYFIFNLTEIPSDAASYFNANYWQQQKRILGSAKGRGTTWFLATEDYFDCNTALRHYYRGGLWGKINPDYYLFSRLEQTRSFAEFYLLNELTQLGLPVPKAIGAKIEKLPLACYRADILMEKIENAQDLTALLVHQSLTEKAWVEIGRLIRQLHQQQICHTDLNAHNILVQQQDTQQKFWLLDFDKCGKKSGDEWKQENLQRLHRSFQKEVGRMNIQFSQQDWQNLLAGYHSN